MGSVKVIHYTHKVYSDGTSPIIIQVIQNRKYFRKTIASIKPSQWDDDARRVHAKKHPNWRQINLNISETFNRVEKLLLNSEGVFIGDPFGEKQTIEENDELTFWDIADKYLEKRKAQSGWTYITFSAVVKKFKNYVNQPSLKLEAIDKTIVQGFMNFAKQQGNAASTIKNNIKILRFISAYAEDNGYGPKPPALHQFKLPKIDTKPKLKLTEQELDAFANVELTPGTKIQEAKDIFLLSVYLRGIRISDIVQLKKSHFKKGRLDYKSNKTGKHFDIKLIKPAIDIVEKYQDGSGSYLFSYFKHKDNESLNEGQNNVVRADHIKTITAYINGKLKEIAKKANITKPISTHIARHTFAKMALDKIGNTNITMDLLGHSDLKVHEAYIREISKADMLDDAVDDIFG